MKITPGLTRTGAFDLEATQCLANQAGFTTFVLPQEGVVNRATFLDAVRATFPLDPPVMNSGCWEALSDSLWEGLYNNPAQRIAILWFNTPQMASSTPADFEIALSVLTDVANSLADPRATHNLPKEIALLVE